MKVLGEATFNRLCRHGVRLFGARYKADAYEETRPNAFCSRCNGWGQVGPHCKAAALKCSICAKDYAETDHRCPVEGRKVGRGRPCPHGTAKCANCGGPHGARADACAAKREARGAARRWRSPPHRDGRGGPLRFPRLLRTDPDRPRGDEGRGRGRDGGGGRAGSDLHGDGGVGGWRAVSFLFFSVLLVWILFLLFSGSTRKENWDISL